MDEEVVVSVSSQEKRQAIVLEHRLHLVTPGEVITNDSGFMRGHGTYVEGQTIKAAVAGVVERVNKLICVRPVRSRYAGEIGDVVVGRIVEVGQKRWKVDTFSRLDSVLMLSSVNLPGGILRRRSAEDELMMRSYFKEGDLISAEVQSVFSDGSLSLHTRSLKYGKLRQGCLVAVAPALIKRRKTHFHNLPCGATLILGNNGYIWIGPLAREDDEDNDINSSERMETEMALTNEGNHEVIARLRNCLLALADQKLPLYDTTILYAYDASAGHPVKDLLKREIVEEITSHVRQL